MSSLDTIDERDLKELDGSLAGDVLALMEQVHPENWNVRYDNYWCHLAPPGYVSRNQGWKLHVSATPLSTATMLSRVVPILFDYRCAFKFARTIERVERLTSAWCERETGGKILTAYPDHDAQFSLLAKELHHATEELPGPAVLSDRAYRPGSVVSYRFGGFSAARVLDDNGRYQPMLVTPDGRWVPDDVFPWFSPPDWVTCPVPADEAWGGMPGGRYRVREAIVHSYRGGVYRGTDVPTGEPVIIKHARPHVGVDRDGRDCRDRLRREGDILNRLSPTGFVPCERDVLEQSGQVFLVEDELPGRSLRDWAEGCARGQSAGDLTLLARMLVRMVMAVHGMGLGIRDLNPANVIVSPEGDRLWLVDLEGVSAPGEPDRRYLTAGYAAPEQYAARAYAPAPPLTADLYSLGVTLLHLCTGMDPALPQDEPPARSAGQRLGALVDLAASQSTEVATVAPLIRGLINDEPDQRWSLDAADRFLAHAADAAPAAAPRREPTATPSRVLEDTLEYLRVTMTPDHPYLWPPERRDLDPCGVAGGAAGNLAVLTRAAQAGLQVHPLVSAAARWLDRRLVDEPRTLPGLHYGRAGTAWALYDAACYLGDEDMAARAVALLASVPVRWHLPGIAHGLAGAGLATIYLWRCTGDPKLSARISAYAQRVLAAVEHDDTGVSWPTGRYGFADGVAGIGAFLLAAGQALDDGEPMEMAQECGQTLCRAAVTIDGAAWWPSGSGSVGDEPAGVGSFLIRLWSATGDSQFLDAAAMAATAVHRDRWAHQPSVLADSGEFLVDMATATGDGRYRDQASGLAACIASRAVLRHGRLVPVDAPLRPVDGGSHIGLTGVLGLMIRLLHGGRRLWMIDPPDGDLVPDRPRHQRVAC